MRKTRSDAGKKRGPRPKRETDEQRLAKPYNKRLRLAAQEAVIVASSRYRINQAIQGMTYEQTDALHIAMAAERYQVRVEDLTPIARQLKQLEMAQRPRLNNTALH